MSNLYLINEVQLGMLVALPTLKEREKFVMDIIVNMQYVHLPKKRLIDNCILINHSTIQKHINKF